MAWPVVTVALGGLPVTDNSALGWGTPIEEAANGLGTAVTYVVAGGMPVMGTTIGYSILLGKNADGSYSALRGQTSVGSYVNLAGK